MFKKSSIRVKFLLLVLAMLIPLIALRANNLINDYQKLLDSELNNYENLAEALSSSYMNYLKEIWTIEDLAGTYLKENPWLSLNDIKSYLNLVKKKQEGILSISWLNPKGVVIVSSSDEIGSPFPDSRNYIQDLLSGKNKVVSDLVESVYYPGQYVVPVALKIEKKGEVVGIVSSIIDIGKLPQRLPNIKIGSEYRFALIDKNGVIVYRSDITNAPMHKQSLMDNASVRKALQGQVDKCVKVRSAIDDQWIISVDYPIKEIGWDCRITFPYEAAVSSHNEFIKNEALALILVTIFSVVMAILFGQSLLKPTMALRTAAKGIMTGDYSARTNIKGGDEIGMAAEAFDKMAESVEQWYKVKNQYFTNMSHEIKTPINVIFASVQLIEAYKESELGRDQYQEKVQKQMKLIRQNCYRIIRLISNLTDISRYDSGYLNVKLGNYDIVTLTRDITLSVERYAEVKGIHLIFQTEIPSRIMACDPDFIERIVLNLISNAIKFTDRGGSVTLSIKEWGNNLVLSVRDTGIGIPENKLNDIFERFKQADDPYCRNKEGSGIGLFLVKALVEAHGGKITVSSQPMMGSTFEVSLPIMTIEGQANFLTGMGKGNIDQSLSAVSRTHIEFSDIYTSRDENIS